MNEIIKNYAEALFSLAVEEKKVTVIKEQLIKINSLFDADLIAFLDSRFIKLSAKEDLLKKTFMSQLDINLFNFINIVVAKKYIRLIKKMQREFIHLANAHLGVNEGIVYSSSTLTTEQLANIEKALEKKINKKIELELRIDKELVGGVKIVTDERVYDYSVKNQIALLEKTILEGLS